MAIKKTDEMYSSHTVKKWFFVASFIFLSSVIAMAVKDFVRPWKTFHISFRGMESKLVDAKLEEARNAIDKDALNQAKQAVLEQENALKARNSEVKELTSKKQKLRGIYEKADQTYRFQKAYFDVDKYDYETLHTNEPESPKTHDKLKKLQASKAKLDELQKIAETTKADLDAVDGQLLELHAAIKEANKQVAAIQKQVKLLELSKGRIDDPLFFFRNGPMTDFISPTVKIEQVVLPDIRYSNNFTTEQRVDRCMTCHLNVNKKGFEDFPNPYRTHPNLDSMVGASSPHPMETTGCTICHSGQGHSVDFNYAAHTPEDQRVAKEWAKPVRPIWHKDVGGFVNSRVCLSDKFKDSTSCVDYLAKQKNVRWMEIQKVLKHTCAEESQKEHALCKSVAEGKDVQSLTAEEYASLQEPICHEAHGGHGGHTPEICNVDFPEPRSLVGGNEWHDLHYWDLKQLPKKHVEANCVRCHYEERYVKKADRFNDATKAMLTYGCYGCHKIQQIGDGVPKPAPSLRNVKGKLTKEWATKWIYDPWSFNPRTRMPRFFGQPNRTLNESEVAWEKEEAIALTNMIWSLSDDYTPAPTSVSGGSVERGKKLVGSLGCLACHASDDFPQGENILGPRFSGLGSKLNRRWLTSWLKNPKHYSPTTRMPSFRLSDSETGDMTEYLLSQKNAAFDAIPAMTSDPQKRDEVLQKYFEARMSPSAAKASVAALTEDQRNQELGKQVMNNAGCWGCHDIKGFEKTPGIGAELTKEAEKQLSRFDFGHKHDVPHTVHDWITAKITSPRQFDEGKVLKWTDRLRMPQFFWREGVPEKITTYVLSLRDDSAQPMQSKRNLDKFGKIAEEGRRVFDNKQCTACHNLIPYNVGGLILAHYQEDNNLGPPKFNLQGEKLHPDWFRKFLQQPVRIRPWLTELRMPSFNYTEQELTQIIGGFNAEDRMPFPWYKDEARELSGGELDEARRLYGELGCTSCHVMGPIAPGTDVSAKAPNLMLARERLRVSWMKKWILQPGVIYPGTRMTALFFKENEEDPKSKWATAYPQYFGGDAMKQIEMLANYLYTIGYKQDPWSGNVKTVDSGPSSPVMKLPKTALVNPHQ